MLWKVRVRITLLFIHFYQNTLKGGFYLIRTEISSSFNRELLRLQWVGYVTTIDPDRTMKLSTSVVYSGKQRLQTRPLLCLAMIS